jgi:MoaA/NifB/PqqE/SkfB family radical SAM enzyme
VLEYAVSKGFNCLKINKTHLLGRFNQNKNYLMNNEEYDDIIKQFDKLSKNYSIELELPREKYFNEKNKFLCSAGKKTIYIAPNGKIFPCPFIPEKFLFGELNKETLNKIIFTNKLFSVDNAFCRACPAMNKSHNITKEKLI